jgi:hypothetical protein
VLKHRDVAEAIIEVATAATVAPVTRLLKLVEQIPDRRIFRRELWREMTRALHVYSSGEARLFEMPHGIGFGDRDDRLRKERSRERF